MPRTRILIVEDLSSLAIAYAAQLEKAGYQPVVADTARAALNAVAEDADFGAMLLDLQLPDADGLQLLRDHPELLRNFPVIVATADASLARAIEAMRLGAFDFLVKPIASTRLVSVVASAVELGRVPDAAARTAAPQPRGEAGRNPGTFIGRSPQMREIYRQLQCVASSRATVFVTGESGTGKEVCAEAIHRESGRANGPFVAINCGAIPENLLESELFGHLKGSFTGAVNDRIGAAQAAHKGTLFLDEICEMALPLQVKLLRFLQTGTVQRVGSNRVEEVDVRIVCATNRDPAREAAEGRFREDLYYRLAVVPIHLPPLRERDGDIPELAEAFLQRFAREERKTFHPLDAGHQAALLAYHWPGNVRELQNILRRATVLHEGPDLPVSAFPPASQGAPLGAAAAAPAIPPIPSGPGGVPSASLAPDLARALKGLTLDEIERLAVEGAIATARGSIPAAARALGVSPSTLYRKRERWMTAAES
ncbi:MAG: sigma-54 dependent transcriptional regulator [Sphingopyxis sp.]|uniref:sigma-54-dependent transcriptional regulator n=1 Tax=Sphingopyxis sp. TaxID=1908224 RepID=UPI002ABBCEC5|nr:sigma-54 dependent transcriptional regulator [Sphingopyxis sp.]MDZ3830817.1 sigma-54 dependent transcriptional regulator [Sphingopyxis sp.]